ncbi:MAG: DinB family protein [Anaerolineae bacterium]|nr:DinB family protein [Anaerolineae bacterium]
MDDNLKTSIWQQFGAAIDYLAAALNACPDTLWTFSMWEPGKAPPERSQVWYVAYHTLFWLDLYLTGAEEGFLPPAPFSLIEQDDEGPIPERPYAKAELLAYLQGCKARCCQTIEALTDETATRRCAFGWGECSFLELLLYNMRHVQEHSAQLNLMLGQNGIATADYPARAGGKIP